MPQGRIPAASALGEPELGTIVVHGASVLMYVDLAHQKLPE